MLLSASHQKKIQKHIGVSGCKSHHFLGGFRHLASVDAVFRVLVYIPLTQCSANWVDEYHLVVAAEGLRLGSPRIVLAP